MRELLLFRHAKSSWDDPDLDDHDRPLTERGAKAAARMGQWLREHDLVPDLILCSTSVRTRATLTLAFSEFLAADTPISFEDALYIAHPDTLLDRLRSIASDHQRVAIIGHNPGLHALALQLVGAGRKKDIRQLAMKYPTAAIAHIVFETEGWDGIDTATGRLATFVTPRSLT